MLCNDKWDFNTNVTKNKIAKIYLKKALVLGLLHIHILGYGVSMP